VISAGGQTIPMFFASINQDQPFGGDFLAQIVVCFPQALKVTKISLNLVEAISTSPGYSVWHAVATPYAGTTANAAGGVEAEGQDRLPWEVTLNAKAVKVAKNASAKQKAAAKGSVVVSGTVRQGNKGVAGATVQVLAGKKVVGSAKAGAGGRYSASIKTTARTLTPRATSVTAMLPSCVEPKFAPLQCKSSTVSGIDITGDAVAVKK
jgi:hypothetical protein